MTKKENKRIYVTISIPKGLMREVDKTIRSNPNKGYTSTTEFCKDAIRKHIDYVNGINSKDILKKYEEEIANLVHKNHD